MVRRHCFCYASCTGYFILFESLSTHFSLPLVSSIPACLPDEMLYVEFAMHDKKLEKLQMAHDVHPVTSPVLIPLSESQEGSNLILSESALSQRLRFRAGIMTRSSCF